MSGSRGESGRRHPGLRRLRRALPLGFLALGPLLSVVVPLDGTAREVPLVWLGWFPSGHASFHAGHTWGNLRFSGVVECSPCTEVVLLLRGDRSEKVRVPLEGEQAVVQTLPAGKSPRSLLVRCQGAQPCTLRMTNVSLSWTGSLPGPRRVRGAIEAWVRPQGLAGALSLGLVVTGILACTAFPALGSPFLYWVGAYGLMCLFPSSFSPLTRVRILEQVSISTLLLMGVCGALVAQAARGRGTARAVVCLAAIGFTARLSAALARPPQAVDVDEAVHWGMARTLRSGLGYVVPDEAYKLPGSGGIPGSWWSERLYLGVARQGEPTASVPPLYPLFLAGLQAAGAREARAVGLVQTVLSLGTAALAGVVARRVAGSLAGLVAFALAVFHAPSAASSGYLFTETLCCFLMMLGLVFIPSSRRGASAAAFAFLGAAALTRSVALALAPVWAGYFLLQRRWGAAVTGLVALCLCLAPWAARNWRELGAPVVASTFAGKDLFMGNNAKACPGETVRWGELSWLQRAWARAGGGGPAQVEGMCHFPVEIQSEVRRDRELRARAWVFAVARPASFARLTGERISQYLGIAPRPEGWEHAGLLPWLWLPSLVLAALSPKGTRAFAFLLVASGLALSLVPLVSIAYSRYRLPMDVVVFPAAGIGASRFGHGRAATP